MKSTDEGSVLYPPIKTPRGLFVLYQPDYATPNVFNLHEAGLFKHRPALRLGFGARFLVSKDLQTAVQYMYLVDEKYVDEETGISYSCVNRHGLVALTPGKKLGPAALERHTIDDRMRKEIERVYDEWAASLPRNTDGRMDVEGITRSLTAAVERGQKLWQGWLIKSNMPWIQPFLPRMMQDFRNGIYQRVGDSLYAEYRQRGGEEPEADVVIKINLFARIYEGEGLLKPDGTRWRSEDEQWDCWIAFSGSEPEAKRLRTTMEIVLPPLREELREELGIDGEPD